MQKKSKGGNLKVRGKDLLQIITEVVLKWGKD